ncbi:FAD/NAD(P)-binding domain-containing protein [Aspergillus steynii IBT 23096]|uniref:FAD/NAD(P)-binding domain-containing protein n=1 Tax=Aspergillus steynii IBT 23096 TaxID=1392250 RepID=A0A2I2GG94_9EURO|nr:FAD/NAD(P)-binding domain-containing protein [Aspergillus steynii IBT 23096]PLB51906.1 FAD/NAD(P)-binding domain-containing protein [Aspergillus steynii IBT 23096]
MTVSTQIRRIAVIGAGPSGLAAVKYLLAEKVFDTIDVFEKRSAAAGVWNYCPGALKQGLSTPVPQLDPNEPLEKPIWPKGKSDPVFVSPIYSTLETNIPKELMSFGDKPFPADSQVLPQHSTVKKYLDDYAEEVRSFIRFETQVEDVRRNGSEASAWTLSTRDLRTGVSNTHGYDAVVVASGHYDVPYTPDITGIKEWNENYPGVISHSKFFDSPDDFRDKKVIVVGSSASGIDIGSQISTVSKGKLLASQRSESFLVPSTAADKEYFPEIVEFLPATQGTRAVRFANGRVESEIDAIVFCTGYLYSFPFLSSLDPPLITDGRRTLNTYQHLFYTYDPTLVLPALPQRVIPFPLSENQAAVYARVWSGRLALPSLIEMEDWEKLTVAQKGNGTSFHLLPFPLDANYMNFLYEWASQASPRPGLLNDGNGKVGNYWGEQEKWLRQLFPEIRREFIAKGEARKRITSLEKLGYDFEQWKRSQEESSVKL